MAKPLLIWAPPYWRGVILTANNLTGTIADLKEADEGSYCTVTTPGGNIVLTIDQLTAQPLSHLALAGELLAGLTVVVESSTNGTTWTAVPLTDAVMANNIANIIPFASNWTQRYFRLTIVSAPAGCRLYHLAGNLYLNWPYLQDGFDALAYKVDATVMTSPQGHLLGIQRNGCNRSLTISFGQLSAGETVPILTLFDECIRTPQGLFFQPDTAQSAVYFGYLDLSKTYGAPQSLGLFTPSPLDFNARVP